MTVKDLIEKLEQYDPTAEMVATAHNKDQTFSLCHGEDDGCTKDDCDSVSIYLDALNESEAM